jgi:hypothetical protein
LSKADFDDKILQSIIQKTQKLLPGFEFYPVRSIRTPYTATPSNSSSKAFQGQREQSSASTIHTLGKVQLAQIMISY